MEIENSSLYQDVLEVTQSGVKPVHYTWKAVLHANGEDIEILKVVSRDTLMEFDAKYAEEMMLTIELGLGTYAHRVYPNQDKLDITLTRYPIGEVGDAQNDERVVQSQRYTAVLVDRGDVKLEANNSNTPTETALNLTQLLTVEFQLINKTLEQLRLKTFGVTLRDTTVEKAVKAILTSFSQKIDVDAAQLPKGVSMVKASNQTKYDQIVFPHGPVRLVQLPAYLQTHYGIYSAALGYFYHQGYWYLYPRYNVERYRDSAQTLTVINVPQNRFTGTERTYRKVGSHLTILATSEVRLEDRSTALQLNAGNGSRYADANKFMEGFVQTKDNKTTVSRARNVSEFISVERPNGMNNIRFSEKMITANPYVEFSKLAERNGAYFSMRWEHSDQSLIVPGMVAKILYLDGEDIKELYGSLIKVHHYDQMAGTGYVSTRFISHSVLVFFVERSIPDTA
jgi:hypothetical protein